MNYPDLKVYFLVNCGGSEASYDFDELEFFNRCVDEVDSEEYRLQSPFLHIPVEFRQPLIDSKRGGPVIKYSSEVKVDNSTERVSDPKYQLTGKNRSNLRTNGPRNSTATLPDEIQTFLRKLVGEDISGTWFYGWMNKHIFVDLTNYTDCSIFGRHQKNTVGWQFNLQNRVAHRVCKDPDCKVFLVRDGYQNWGDVEKVSF